MGRSVMLGNGHMLVGLNEKGLVHDFYYPYVGLDNLTTSRSIHHNIGVWVEDKFSWLDDPAWQIETDFEEDALISVISAKNNDLAVELVFNDFVDSEYTAFCRYITIKNNTDRDREIRLFMHQAFQISRGGRGDTALYVPSGNYILDYKGWCSLLIYAQNEAGQPFDQFAVGNYGIEGKEGTFRDAEDGQLSNNLVEHGGVDSVVRTSNQVAANNSAAISYWTIAAESHFDADVVHRMLIKHGLPRRLDVTRAYWRDWLAVGQEKMSKIDPAYLKMVKKSLLVIKAHTDRHGGIIASCDSSIYNYGRDYYCYVWPRDGALITLPLIELGFTHEPRRFFEFCADTMHPGGYMMHKYQPDRSIGSTWHPLLHKHHPELAIQEDETASVIYALGFYMQKSGDEEFVRSLYNGFVKPACDFMTGFVDQATKLPHASYDLWEERFATHTYTVAMTIAALKMAATIAEKFEQSSDVDKWHFAAEQIRNNMNSLFKEEGGYWRKSLTLSQDGTTAFDDTLDTSSAYGMDFIAEIMENPGTLDQTYDAIEKRLLNSSPSGGVPRYEHDNYFLDHQEYIGNPWMISTLWLAQHYIRKDQKDKAKELIDWVANHATNSGMLSEQVDPANGGPVGVSPLVWSHAAFVDTVLLLAKES